MEAPRGNSNQGNDEEREMLGRIHIFAAAALCVSSYAMAASPSIGTVTTHGNTRIDNYEVKGSGTLFEGSVIETDGSSADLRLANNGAVVTLYGSSRGTLHTDHFLLERGIIKLSSSNSFNVQADNLVVVPAGDSSGLVTVEDNNSVVVEAEKGTFEVRNAAGTRIAQVHPGSPLSFTSTGKSSSGITATSAVPSRKNQHDLPTVDANMVPAGLGLAGVSAQTSSQLGSISPRASNLPNGCPTQYPIAGHEGGCCKQNQVEKCCPHDKLQLCCPGFVPQPPVAGQCGASQ
jgi:hypothetical protein